MTAGASGARVPGLCPVRRSQRSDQASPRPLPACLPACPLPAGGCGKKHPVTVSLDVDEAPPGIFTLQLTWESDREEPADIGATLSAVGEEVGWAAWGMSVIA